MNRRQRRQRRQETNLFFVSYSSPIGQAGVCAGEKETKTGVVSYVSCLLCLLFVSDGGKGDEKETVSPPVSCLLFAECLRFPGNRHAQL